MKTIRRISKLLLSCLGAVAIVIGLIAGSISPAWAANPIPGVIPPQAKPYGMTY